METKSSSSTLSATAASYAERYSEGDSAVAALHVVHAPNPQQVGTQAALSSEVLPIGRDLREEGLCLDDARLSRLHVRLTFDRRAAAYRIGDARSHNGTFVNGHRIDTAVLSNGDVIRVGDTILVHRDREPMSVARAKALEAAPLTTSLLLRGEPGTGKEVLARLVHEQSGRDGEFVPIDCASIPHEAFNGGLSGYFERAIASAALQRSGVSTPSGRHTLFLDEVGACPLPLQQALLRALERVTPPVDTDADADAGHDPLVNLRIIAATHVNLQAAVTTGAFLANLYVRVSELTVEIPPLRERRVEIISLAEEFARGLGKSLSLSSDAAEAILCWHWPFNLRELQTLIAKCLTRRESSARLGLKELQLVRSDIVQPILERRTKPHRAPEQTPPSEPVERRPESRSEPEIGPGPAPEAHSRYVFRQEGEIWTLVFDGKASRLKDIRGLHYIAMLLRHPGVHLHVLELAASPGTSVLAPENDAPPLDETARSAYRRRLAELNEDLAAAETERNEASAARARYEIESLTEQLASMYGFNHGRR